MRKKHKDQILNILRTMNKAQTMVRNYIEKIDYERAFILLRECQQAAISIGEQIEKTEGEECVIVRLLEDYCEQLYLVGKSLGENISVEESYKMLKTSLDYIKDKIESDIEARLEVVFLPYKASMWDSLESIWIAAQEDSECDSYVIPIPYYDKNPDNTFGTFHYEGNQFPKNVPITHYEEYDFEERRPDVIYIHNPYDHQNRVTSVDPRFYSYELKKYTEMLVYIPYYVVVRGVFQETMITTSAFAYADRIILQSKMVCEQYAEVYKKYYEEQLGKMDQKFIALGSPKFDAVINAKREKYSLPKDWKELINQKKVVFLNTSISSSLRESENFLKKLRLLIEDFKNCEDMVLWWRPHPILESTFMSMRPQLAREYLQIVDMYKQNNIGIFDDTPDLYRAITWGDIFYSDGKSSIYTLCCATGKPVVEFIVGDKEITMFADDYKHNTRDNSSFDVLLRNENIDGTCGIKIHEYICQEVVK